MGVGRGQGVPNGVLTQLGGPKGGPDPILGVSKES